MTAVSIVPVYGSIFLMAGEDQPLHFVQELVACLPAAKEEL